VKFYTDLLSEIALVVDVESEPKSIAVNDGRWETTGALARVRADQVGAPDVSVR